MSLGFSNYQYNHNHYSLDGQSSQTNSFITTDSFRTDIDDNLRLTASSYTNTQEQNLDIQTTAQTQQISSQSWDFGWDFFRPNTPDLPNSNGYSSTNGYGLIDASSAVARAAGEDKFTDVPDIGGNNWGADLVNAPSAWGQGYTGEGVVVAVLDTGVDRNHEDLNSNIWTNSGEIADNGIDDDGNGYIDDVFGWNFDANNNNTLDVDGHGTHVSGTIAAENNDLGATGVAYGAKIMPVKVLDDNGSGTNSAIARGIYYAVDNGANVINLSLGGGSYNQELENAVQYASSQNVIVVMAAGNNGGSQPIYPARYADKSGVAVGAVNRSGEMADFSNRSGDKQLSYVTAPGVDVFSTLPNNQYAAYSGTSMATPHVAGVVALMLSANPNLSDGDVRQILADTSKNSQSSTFPESFNFSGNSSINSFVNSSGNQPLAITPDYGLRYDLSDTDSRFVSFPRVDDRGLADRFQNLNYGDKQADINPSISGIVPLSVDSFTTNGNTQFSIQTHPTNQYNSAKLTDYSSSQTTSLDSDILDPQLWSQFQQERQLKQIGNGGGNEGGNDGGDDLIDPDLFNRERDRILLEYRDWLRLLPATA